MYPPLLRRLVEVSSSAALLQLRARRSVPRQRHGHGAEAERAGRPSALSTGTYNWRSRRAVIVEISCSFHLCVWSRGRARYFNNHACAESASGALSREARPPHARACPHATRTRDPDETARARGDVEGMEPEAEEVEDDEPTEHKGAAKARQRGLEASQVLAVCADWACVAADPVCLLRLADRTPTTLSESGRASCACFDGSGTRLLLGGEEKQVLLFDELPPGRAPCRRWTHNKKIGCVAFSPDGFMALYADLFGEVHGVSLADAEGCPTLVLGHLSQDES